LLEKAAVLEGKGMGARFYCLEPFFLPESFFREHPELRGPRVDHPRRSHVGAFAMCIDHEETLAIYEWMMRELRRSVPGLGAFEFMANDSGSGFCWWPHLYPGPNGPTACRHRSLLARLTGFFEALHRGAAEGGGDVPISFYGSLGSETFQLADQLPGETFVVARGARPDPRSGRLAVATGGTHYPVRGLVDPLAVIKSMEAVGDPNARVIALRFAGWYGRHYELPETVAKTLEIVVSCIETPVAGFLPALERLRELSASWGGQEKADELCEAFVRWNEAQRLVRLAPGMDTVHSACSLRYVTRPLVLRPDRLAVEEEAYFLPYVFNTDENEARMDYADRHAYRIDLVGRTLSIPPAERGLAAALGAAEVFEDCADGPDGEWLAGLGASVRIWASLIRSCRNFYLGQVVRDMNRARLAEEPPVHDKLGPDSSVGRDIIANTYGGERDRLTWFFLLRDELDNTAELLALVEGRGRGRLWRAPDARHQDTFVLGPDLEEDLKAKARIMRAHWCEADEYFVSL
jgi:hypothetical protein